MSKEQYSIFPIGKVTAKNDTFAVKLEEPYRRGLEGLEGYSHVVVLWWAHMVASDEYRGILEADAPYTKGPDRVGIFATRSPLRPNPIAVSHAPVLSIDKAKGTITFPYIDAEDGTPVLDIKPYHPSEDRIKAVSVPDWCDHWPKWYEDSGDFDWESEFNF